MEKSKLLKSKKEDLQQICTDLNITLEGSENKAELVDKIFADEAWSNHPANIKTDEEKRFDVEASLEKLTEEELQEKCEFYEIELEPTEDADSMTEKLMGCEQFLIDNGIEVKEATVEEEKVVEVKEATVEEEKVVEVKEATVEEEKVVEVKEATVEFLHEAVDALIDLVKKKEQYQIDNNLPSERFRAAWQRLEAMKRDVLID